MAEPVEFTFDGRPLTTRSGLTLAAALTDAGIRGFREGPGDTPRGLFCGMGVCQDCLVEVDDRPNRRACMTKAESGMVVRTQPARPELKEQNRARRDPVVEAPDVLVAGGGAGGLSAAIAAAESGADVLLLDERTVAGGQYFKQRGDGAAALDWQQAAGAAFRKKAEASGARLLDGAEIWGAFDGPVVYATQQGAAVVIRPKTLIVAAGAYERPRFVPGWDLPGVMTTGAAQTLWRSYGTLPGRRVAVVGNGPLNLQVADELRRGGAEIVGVAEAASAPWWKIRAAVAMLVAAPRLTLTGLATTLALLRRGIPVRYGAAVYLIESVDGGLSVQLSGAGAPKRWTADVVCMNYGFHPQNEILRLLGAGFDYAAAPGQLICRRSADCETTVPGLYAVGDCAGMGGAPAAVEEGEIAGRAAAATALGSSVPAAVAAHRRLARHRRFQRALWTLFAAPPQRYEDIAAEALLCRCEGLRKAEIDGPAAEPGAEIGNVKRATRVGMGRCQGRYCAQVLAPHIATSQGRPVDERAFFAPRVPIKPVEIADILAAEEADSAGT